jgi:cardiolipin synthase
MDWKQQLLTVFSHVLSILTLVLAVLLVARLLSERRQPSATFAWLLGIGLVPYVGIPLFLLFGGRKIRKLAREKDPLRPPPTGQPRISVSGSFLPNFEGAYPVSHDNSVMFLDRGEDTFREFVRQIEEARESIEILTFILGNDSTGQEIVERLARRASEGVRVRVLLDALGSMATLGQFVQPLRDAGASVAKFMPVFPIQSRWSANLRNHRKIAVFDGARAIVGGHNLAREYLGAAPERDRWIDFGALICGSAALDLRRIFLADWNYATDESESESAILEAFHRSSKASQGRPDGSSSIQVMAGGPDVPDDTLHEAIVSLIQEADSRLWIITPYFVPDEVVFRSLLVKARTRREIRLIIPERSNHHIADVARRHALRDLHRAGVEILLHRGPMLHAKALIADDRIGMIGSVNMDARSLLVNFEVGVFLRSPQDVLALSHWADGLVRQCRRFGCEELETKPGGRLSTLAEDAARLIAPLL